MDSFIAEDISTRILLLNQNNGDDLNLITYHSGKFFKLLIDNPI